MNSYVALGVRHAFYLCAAVNEYQMPVDGPEIVDAPLVRSR